MIDIHAHVLPGVDDGATDLAMSLEMCALASDQGITTLVATPHYWPGVYWSCRQDILKKTVFLNCELQQRGNRLKVLPGMEVFLDIDVHKRVSDGAIVTINDTGKYLLVELPWHSLPPYTEIILCRLQTMGITPILAHPERNSKIINEPGLLYGFLEKGILVQVTAASLTGAFGKSVQDTTRLLLEHEWAHFIASDSHDPVKRPYLFTEAVAIAEKFLGKERVQALVLENPLKVIEGTPIIPGQPKKLGEEPKNKLRRKEKQRYLFSDTAKNLGRRR